MKGSSAVGRRQVFLSDLARLWLPWQVQSSCAFVERQRLSLSRKLFDC